jgi:hypothetical protein
VVGYRVSVDGELVGSTDALAFAVSSFAGDGVHGGGDGVRRGGERVVAV